MLKRFHVGRTQVNENFVSEVSNKYVLIIERGKVIFEYSSNLTCKQSFHVILDKQCTHFVQLHL